MNKVWDITPVKQICKWCRLPIRNTGLEHFVCKATWSTTHEWAHKDSFAPTKTIHIEVKEDDDDLIEILDSWLKPPTQTYLKSKKILEDLEREWGTK